NSELQFLPTSEGFYDYIKNQYIYQYKDHLGNTRVSFGKNSAGVLEIVDANDYYPFGMNHLKSGNSFFGSSSYKNYKYNGKELQETGMYDYGARFYMADIGRFGVLDRFSEKFPFNTLYSYASNNPILFIDKNGDYAVSVHYDITYRQMLNLGYSASRADLIAHYSSTYADHPSSGVLHTDNILHNKTGIVTEYRKGIDYSITAKSQDEANSKWHSMMSNEEAENGMTEYQAMLRGLSFGWNNIFTYANSSDDSKIGNLGQGLHALQDAIAHKGVKTDDHLGYNFSSGKKLTNDMYGSTTEAALLTKSALIVVSVIRGEKIDFKKGETLDFRGMSKNQFNQFVQALLKQGFQGIIKNR
ncbi:RHS repeat-associated core domain-containing protein, partial [Chryseobacterium gambrini]